MTVIRRTTIIWGLCRGWPGDNIYNGAADNGDGRAGCCWRWRGRGRRESGVKPPHSVIFAAVTAEEQGLLGSEYLGQHPPVPAGQIALDINYDMILPIGVPQQVNVNGAQRTTFYPVVQATAKRFGLAIVAGSAAGGGELLSRRSFQPVAGGDSGVFD